MHSKNIRLPTTILVFFFKFISARADLHAKELFKIIFFGAKMPFRIKTQIDQF